jgi:hypothetical protein
MAYPKKPGFCARSRVLFFSQLFHRFSEKAGIVQKWGVMYVINKCFLNSKTFENSNLTGDEWRKL